MFNFYEDCCICLNNKQYIYALFESKGDDIPFYVKLTSSVPEMFFEGLTDRYLICKECSNVLHTVYAFRQKCLQNKPILIRYIPSSDVINDSTKINVTENNIKTEPVDVNTDYVGTSFREDLEPNFTFVSVNNAESVTNSKLENWNEVWFRENDIKQAEIFVSEQNSENEGNITLNDAKTGNTEANSEEKQNNISENSLNDLHNPNLINNCKEIKTEELDIKVEENWINEQSSNNKGKPLSTHEQEDDLYSYETSAQNEEKEEINKAKRGNNHRCPVCNKTFSKSSNVNTHMKIHTGEKPYECSVCNRKFIQSYSLKTHMILHTGETPHECNICHKKFTVVGHLKTHMNTHTGEKLHKCTVCNRTFTQLGNLKTHMNTHTKEKIYECTICGKKITSPRNFKTHMRMHEEEGQYTCNICTKEFTILRKYQRHIKTHSTFECTVCNKIFSQKYNLKIHMLIHTGETPHECTVCNRKFSQQKHLKSHMVIHSEERPHECNVCQRKFNQFAHLKKHMIMHTGINQHTCSVCDKKFSSVSDLKVHMNVHTGDGLHECNICQKKILRLADFKRHMKIHDRNRQI